MPGRRPQNSEDFRSKKINKMVGFYWVLLNLLFVTVAQNGGNCALGPEGGDICEDGVQNDSLYDVVSPLLDGAL